MGHKMVIEPRQKTLSEEVAQMAQADEDNIGEVGGQQDIVRRLLFLRQTYCDASGVRRGVPKALVRAMAELRVYSGEDLLGGGGDRRQGQPIRVVGLEFFQHCVLRRRGGRRRQRQRRRDRGRRTGVCSGARVRLGDGGEVGRSACHSGERRGGALFEHRLAWR